MEDEDHGTVVRTGCKCCKAYVTKVAATPAQDQDSSASRPGVLALRRLRRCKHGKKMKSHSPIPPKNPAFHAFHLQERQCNLDFLDPAFISRRHC